MRCTLCNNEIERYDVKFNTLEINNSIKVNLCQNCISKIMKWQKEIILKLFPIKRFNK